METQAFNLSLEIKYISKRTAQKSVFSIINIVYYQFQVI